MTDTSQTLRALAWAAVTRFDSSAPSASPTTSSEALVRWQQRELRGRRARAAGRADRARRRTSTSRSRFSARRPAGEAPAIVAALRTAAAEAGELRLALRGYRETRSVGMLIFDDEGGRATALAERLHGSARGARASTSASSVAWLPHVTVLRFRERAGPAPAPAGAGRASLRPTRLFTSHGCDPVGRSTRFSRRPS